MNASGARVGIGLTAAILIVSAAIPARAQTAFGIRSFGEPLPMTPPHALAVGGVAAVAPWGGDPAVIGAVNPALPALADRVLYSFTWEIGRLSGSYGDQTGGLNRSGPRLAGIILPVGGGFALSGGLQRLSASDFEIHSRGTVGNDLNVRQDYYGTGGLNRAWAGLAWRLSSGLVAAGFTTELVFGNFKQEWAVNFDDSGYVDAEDTLHRQHRGTRWSAGVQLEPLDRLRLGAAYISGGRLDVNWITSSVASGADTSEGRLELGHSLALSAGWSASDVWALYLDYGVTVWDETRWVGTPPAGGGAVVGPGSGLRADGAVGFGIERRARPPEEQTSFIDAIPLRLGVRTGQLYAPGPDGGKVSRLSVMLGTAFFIGTERRAWSDITLQLGRYRAGNGDQETYWRLTIGFSGAERWFLPPQR